MKGQQQHTFLCKIMNKLQYASTLLFEEQSLGRHEDFKDHNLRPVLQGRY